MPRFPGKSLDAGRRGFTLVELLIAVTILTVALMAGLQSQASSIELMKEARETEVAIEILRDGMANLMLEENSELCDEGGDLSPGAEIGSYSVLEDQSMTYSLPDYTKGAAVPTCLTLRVDLSWTTASGRARTMSLVGAKR